MEDKTTYKVIVLRKEVHWTTRMGGFKGRCVYGFAIFCWDLLLCCSVFVDSHACDENLPWQEPWENHCRTTPACLELLVNTQQP